MKENHYKNFKISKNLHNSNPTNHWIYQRLTALLLIPLSIWSIIFIKYCLEKNSNDIIIFIKKPYNLIPLLIFILTTYYHALLGMQVIFEDYIKNIFLRNLLIFLLKSFSFLTLIILIIAFFKLGHKL